MPLFFTPLRAHPRRRGEGLVFYCVPTRVWEEGLVFYFVPTRVGGGGVAPTNLCLFSSRHCVPTRVWGVAPANLCSLFFTPFRAHPRRRGGWRRWLSFYCIPTRVCGGLPFTSYLLASGGGVAPPNLCSLFSSRHCILTRVCWEVAILLLHPDPRRWGSPD